MNCRNCGNPLNDGAQFCPKCGTKTAAPPQGAGMQQQPGGPYAPGNAPYTPPAGNAPYAPPGGNVPYTPPAGNVPGGTPKKKSKAPAVIASVLVVVLLAVIGGYFISRDPADGGATDYTDPDAAAVSADIVTVSDADSVSELLALIDQAETAMEDSMDVLLPILDSDDLTASDLNSAVTILDGLCASLEDTRAQANAVAGVDTKLSAAAQEYFDMTYGACSTLSKMFLFSSDLSSYSENVLMRYPDENNYSSDAAYYSDFLDWSDAAKEAYLEINSCPPNAEQDWQKVGNSLDLLGESVYKIYVGTEYDDPLRMYTGKFMLDRFVLTLDFALEGCGACMDGEIQHAGTQIDLADALLEEMHAYQKMSQDEREAYEFKNIYAGVVDPDMNLSYETVDTIYPSLYNSYDSFLIIKTGCFSGSRRILVEAEIPGLTQKYAESFTLSPAYTEIRIKPPALTGDLNLTSAKDAQISVTISDQDGNWIDNRTFPVAIKSKYDFEWISDDYGVVTQDNILCFLTPESSAITQLKTNAITSITSMTGGVIESFAGYQNTTQWPDAVVSYLQAAGLMRAMYDMGVRYTMDSFSISGSNQHILLPPDVLEQSSGLCIETSLVIASALQSAGMHAFLVFPPGHAQVALETWSGSTEYFLIETTALSSSSNTQEIFVEYANMLLDGSVYTSGYPIVYKTTDEWWDYLAVPGTYVVDCDDSRILGLTPFAN